MLVVDFCWQPMDFTCVETQIGDGSKADCEILEIEATERIFVAAN